MRRVIGLASVVALAGLPIWACGSDPCSFGECAASGNVDGGGLDGSVEGGSSGSTDGSTDAPVIVPPGCNLVDEPKNAPNCVTETLGLFVNRGEKGSDTEGNGSRDKPFKTIGKALVQANTQRFRIYVCEGTYIETLTLAKAASVYGGFSCADWKHTAAATKVAPSSPGYALRVTNVSNAEIFDMAFEAKAASGTELSSIAAFVTGSTVSFRRAQFVAGDALPAPAAAAFTSNWFGGDLTGSAAGNPTLDKGGDAKLCVCKDGVTSSTGGKGGNAGANGGAGTAQPNPNGTIFGKGGSGYADPTPCSGGVNGTAGAAATAAAGGAKTHGTVKDDRWIPEGGANGATGGPGGGGGGGGGGETNGSGGGGCGGCGGAGGPAGAGGGASIGILSVDSKVSLDTCTMQLGSGGAGADGASGQEGDGRGDGGNGACGGGKGGNGGAGGGGGGGAGGLVAGVVHKGAAPTFPAPDVKGGTAGKGGAGGLGGTGGAKGLDGLEGVKKDVVAL